MLFLEEIRQSRFKQRPNTFVSCWFLLRDCWTFERAWGHSDIFGFGHCWWVVVPSFILPEGGSTSQVMLQDWQWCSAALLWALARNCLWCMRSSSGREGTKPWVPPSAQVAVLREGPCHSSLGLAPCSCIPMSQKHIRLWDWWRKERFVLGTVVVLSLFGSLESKLKVSFTVESRTLREQVQNKIHFKN